MYYLVLNFVIYAVYLILLVYQSRKLRWVGFVAWMSLGWGTRNVYSILLDPREVR